MQEHTKRPDERKDMLICGANGFTAKKLIELVVEQRPNMRIGVTCRSREKLEHAFAQIRKSLGKSLDTIDTHITGVNDSTKLAQIFAQYKVVVNCIGPFAQTGLQVVDTAIAAQTHYIDCTGEPAFIEQSYELCTQKAKDAGVLVVHACGFDSLPLDIGMVYTVQELHKKVQVKEMHAESHMQLINCKINIGTFKTVIASIDTMKTRADKRRKQENTKQRGSTRAKKVRRMPYFCKTTKMYTAMFPGSDAYVLRKTKQCLGSKYPACHCYISTPRVLGLVCLMLFALLAATVHLLPHFARRFVYAHIDAITFGAVRRKGPTDKEIACAGFQTRIFVTGKDEAGAAFCFSTMVSGPDPGYITTPAALLVSAETIIHNAKGCMQGRSGVFTPGSAFHDTDIIERLKAEQIMFSMFPNNICIE